MTNLYHKIIPPISAKFQMSYLSYSAKILKHDCEIIIKLDSMSILCNLLYLI